MITLCNAVPITRPLVIFGAVRIDIDAGVGILNRRGKTIHPKNFLEGDMIGR